MLRIKTKGNRLSVKWTSTLDNINDDLRKMYEMATPDGGDEIAFDFLKVVFVRLMKEVCRGGDVESMRHVLRDILWRTRGESEYKSYKII